jgi:hypothetical protein
VVDFTSTLALDATKIAALVPEDRTRARIAWAQTMQRWLDEYITTLEALDETR